MTVRAERAREPDWEGIMRRLIVYFLAILVLGAVFEYTSRLLPSGVDQVISYCFPIAIIVGVFAILYYALYHSWWPRMNATADEEVGHRDQVKARN